MCKKNKVVSLLFCMIVGCGITGCHTVDGAGKDIEKAGESIQGSSH